MNFTLFFFFFSFFFHYSYSRYADIIIVGGGTAGCVLASRLCTQLPRASIILLERGHSRSRNSEFLVRAPRNTLDAWNDTSIAESFSSLPNPGLHNRSIRFITGNTLGGSSAINGMQWTVPIGKSIDRWGIRGLTSRTALRYFRRAYRQLNPEIPVSKLQQTYARLYVNAAKMGRIPEIRRPFDMKAKDGIWENFLVARNGRRRDSFTAYLEPLEHTICRNNLQIIRGVTVTKILTSKEEHDFKAIGVEYVDSHDRSLSNKMNIFANEQVILSAGPTGSPKLLQLSGIGPKSLLQEMGIDELISTPIGERTQARPLTLTPMAYTQLPIPPENDPSTLQNPTERLKYELRVPSVFNIAIAAVNGVFSKVGYFTSTYIGSPAGGLGTRFLAHGCFTNPSSFGTLRIQSKNPFDAPHLQLNLMGSSSDLSRTVKCLQRLSSIVGNFQPPTNIVPLVKDVDEDFVKQHGAFGFHYVGGCAAGHSLTSDLQVPGLTGLRVVDVSVIPEIPISAGTMSSTYMIAEFVSEKLVDKFDCTYGREGRCGRW